MKRDHKTNTERTVTRLQSALYSFTNDLNRKSRDVFKGIQLESEKIMYGGVLAWGTPELFPELFQGPFLNAGYIGAGDAEEDAISRCVKGMVPPNPYLNRMISASRVVRFSRINRRSCRALSRSWISSSIVSSTPTTSMSCRVFPSLSVSMESESDTSPCSFFWLRKYIRISFSMHLAA